MAGAGNATFGTTNGPVVDPNKGFYPKMGWHTHAESYPAFIRKYEKPGLLRRAFHNVLQPETQYVAYCAQEAGRQGPAEIAHLTFTTKAKPAQIGEIGVSFPNKNLTSIKVNVTFNRDNLAGCYITRKGADRPSITVESCQKRLVNSHMQTLLLPMKCSQGCQDADGLKKGVTQMVH